MNRNSILYLSYEGMTDPLGQSQVLSYMMRLSPYYRISIISCEKKNRYRSHGKEIAGICKQHGIEWHPLFYTKSPPLLSTVYDVWKMRRKAISLCRENKFSIVHCRSYVTSIVGLQLKEKYGVRFIFDMRGFWIDEKIEGGYWKTGKWFYRAAIKYLRTKENQFYEKSDAIVSLTNAGKDEIKRIKPHLEKKTYVIPTCVNLTLFKPFQQTIRDRIRKEMGIPAAAFVLLYSGGYGANYNIAFLKETYQKIKEKRRESYILVLSKDGVTGLENDALKQYAFSISVPYSKVSDYLMAGDIGLINYTNQFSVAGRSPTKLAEYWASGLPAIAPRGIGDIDYIFSRCKGSGILYDETDFHERIEQVLAVSKQTLRMYAEEYFSLDRGAEKYREIYEELIRNSGG